MFTDRNKVAAYLIMEYGFIKDNNDTLLAVSPGTDIIYRYGTNQVSFVNKAGKTSEPVSQRTLMKLNRLIKL